MTNKYIKPMEKYELVLLLTFKGHISHIWDLWKLHLFYTYMAHICQKPMENYITRVIIYSIITLNNKSPWFKSMQNYFINGIQSHNQSPWFKPMANYLSKPKPNNAWQYLIKSPIQLGNILKAHDSSPWQNYYINGI